MGNLGMNYGMFFPEMFLLVGDATQQNMHPTSGSLRPYMHFPRFEIIHVSKFYLPRPLAGNVGRWADAHGGNMSGYGVYLNNSEKPMAIFIREEWAIAWQKLMQAKTAAGTLYVRPTTLAPDAHGRVVNIEKDEPEYRGLGWVG